MKSERSYGPVNLHRQMENRWASPFRLESRSLLVCAEILLWSARPCSE